MAVEGASTDLKAKQFQHQWLHENLAAAEDDDFLRSAQQVAGARLNPFGSKADEADDAVSLQFLPEHARTHARTHDTHTRARAHTHTHKHTHTTPHTRTHSHTHTPTHTHTHTHTRTHTHQHTHQHTTQRLASDPML